MTKEKIKKILSKQKTKVPLPIEHIHAQINFFDHQTSKDAKSISSKSKIFKLKKRQKETEIDLAKLQPIKKQISTGPDIWNAKQLKATTMKIVYSKNKQFLDVETKPTNSSTKLSETELFPFQRKIGPGQIGTQNFCHFSCIRYLQAVCRRN